VVAKLGDLSGSRGAGAAGSRLASQTPLSGTGRVNGRVLTTPGPVLAEDGTLNNMNPRVGALLAPGTIAQIYGLNLAASDQSNAPGVLLPPKKMTEPWCR
jgi:hypothetical protein